MWGGRQKQKNGDKDLTWLVEDMKDGAIEWCADVAYDRAKTPNTNGAECMCCRTETKEDGTSPR